MPPPVCVKPRLPHIRVGDWAITPQGQTFRRRHIMIPDGSKRLPCSPQAILRVYKAAMLRHSKLTQKGVESGQHERATGALHRACQRALEESH